MNFSCFKTLKENEEEAIDLLTLTRLAKQLTNRRIVDNEGFSLVFDRLNHTLPNYGCYRSYC